MAEILVREGQNIFDVAVQNFGTVDNVFDLIAAGDLTLTENLAAGTIIEVETENKGVESIKEFYRKDNLVTNNSVPPVVAEGGDFNNDFNNDF